MWAGPVWGSPSHSAVQSGRSPQRTLGYRRRTGGQEDGEVRSSSAGRTVTNRQCLKGAEGGQPGKPLHQPGPGVDLLWPLPPELPCTPYPVLTGQVSWLAPGFPWRPLEVGCRSIGSSSSVRDPERPVCRLLPSFSLDLMGLGSTRVHACTCTRKPALSLRGHPSF